MEGELGGTGNGDPSHDREEGEVDLAVNWSGEKHPLENDCKEQTKGGREGRWGLHYES